MAELSKLPPPPSGYSLDSLPPPPAGYSVDGSPTKTAPALYGHPGYQSNLPWVFGRMDNAVSDSVNAMAEGAQKLFGKDKTTDERLGGASQMGRGFVNSAGAPMLARTLVAAPLKTVLGVGTGLVGQAVGSTAAQMAGAGPGTQDFVGDATGLATGLLTSRLPGSRLGSAAQAGTKAAVKATPILGKGAMAAVEDWRKSAPEYVDPKIAAEAARQAKIKADAATRSNAYADAKAKRIASAEAKAKTDADALAATDKAKAAQIGARVDATQGSAIPPSSIGPLPNVEPIPSSLPSGRVPGTGEPNLPPPPSPPVRRVSLYQKANVQPTPNAPPAMAPVPQAAPTLPSGRVPGSGTGEPPQVVTPPPRISLYKKAMEGRVSEPPPQTAPPAPTAPPMLPSGRLPGTGEPKVSAPPLAPQPPIAAPPAVMAAAATNAGPSAPEGSTVIPPKPGVKFDAHDVATMEKINASRAANDAKVSAYLKGEGITKDQWGAATQGQKQAWAKAAGSKSRYDNPARVQHMTDMLDADAPTGPTLYQGKQ